MGAARGFVMARASQEWLFTQAGGHNDDIKLEIIVASACLELSTAPVTVDRRSGHSHLFFRRVFQGRIPLSWRGLVAHFDLLEGVEYCFFVDVHEIIFRPVGAFCMRLQAKCDL